MSNLSFRDEVANAGDGERRAGFDQGDGLVWGAMAEADTEGRDELALVLQSLAVDRGNQEGLMGPTQVQFEDSNVFGRNGIPAAEDVSDWVLKRITEVSQLLGLSFKGYKEEALRLFSAIEASWRKGSPSNPVGTVAETNRRGKRELRNLVCSINYEQGGARADRDSHRRRGVPLLLK